MEIIEKLKTLQINPSVLEDLVQEHYQESRKNNFFRWPFDEVCYG